MRTLVLRPQVHPLDRPQDVRGGQDHREGGDHGQHAAVVPTGERDQHFPDETAQTGESQAGEEHRHREPAVHRHAVEDAAELLEIAVVHPVVEHAHHEEHAGRRDAVGEHLEHRAVDSLRPRVPPILVARHGAPHAEAQHHVAHVAHRAVRDHALEVLLCQGGKGAIHHRHDAQPAHEPREVEPRTGADGIADPQDPVAAELEQHPGENHRDRRRSLDVGVGEPGMDRHHRHLDHEPDEEQQKRPLLQAHAPQLRGRERRGGQLADLRQRQQVERVQRGLGVLDGPHRVGLGSRIEPGTHDVARDQLLGGQLTQVAREIQHQDRQQHQDAAQQRVQEELDRRVLPPRPAPDADEEIHRQQHHLPEHVEQEEVERHEHAEHARHEQQKEDVVGLHVLRDRPARRRRQHRQERGEHDERETDAVHAQQVLDPEGLDPRQLDDGLHARLTETELRRPGRPEQLRPRHPQRQHEHDRGREERRPTNEFLAGLGHDRQ